MSHYDRSNPFVSRIKERFSLTKKGSTKETYHISLSLPEDFSYTPGDSIAVLPCNDSHAVTALLEALHCSGSETIHDPRSGHTLSLLDHFTHKANIQKTHGSLLRAIQERAPTPELAELLEQKPQLSAFLENRTPLQLFRSYPQARFAPEELPKLFLPLLPRFYSIASSQRFFPHEVHLTVAAAHYLINGEPHPGVCSHFLSHRALLDQTPIPIYLQPSHGFRLPDPAASMILIGPGTGVAPYRAFLQERLATHAPGRNWLFFGERHSATDFYYEDFWRELAAKQRLRLDLAFSRDGPEKVYVQHRMWEQRKDLWAWIEEGAHFYVCGDAQEMAKDVEATLQRIAVDQGHLHEDEARRKIKSLRAEKRYLTDVY